MTEIPTFPPTRKAPPPLVVVIFASVLGGMAGTLLLFGLFPEFRQAQIPPGIDSVVVERPGKVVIEEEARLDDLRNQASAYVGEVFAARSVGTNTDEALWLVGDIKAYATMLTNDGYFVTANQGVAIGDYIRVRNGNYVVKEIATDPSSGLIFGRADGAGLSSPRLAIHKSLKPGTLAVAVLADRGLKKTTISSLSASLNPEQGNYLNSDTATLGYSVTDNAQLLGVPYFDISGNLIGLQADPTSSAIVPAYVIQTALDKYLQTGKIDRVKAGIQYVSVPNKEGVVVFRRLGEGTATTLALNDRITAINGQTITSDPHSFAQIFLALSSTAELKLTVQRGDETLEMTQPLNPL